MDEPTEAELRAFFGPRASYYLAQWRGTARRRYNLAAFFISGVWLPYRRLYRHAAGLWGLALGLGLMDAVAAHLGRPPLPKLVDLLISLVITGGCAVMANGWYLARARDAISRVRARSLPPEQHLEQIAQAGGTRIWHAVGFTAAALVAYLVIVFAAFTLLEMTNLR